VPAWVWPTGLVLLALCGAREVGAAEPAASPPLGHAVDAEMLRDLDVLSSPDYARDHEVARRMGLFEGLRLLESPAADDAAASRPARSDPTKTTAPAKEGR
jgi:hypothetical protein